MAGQVQIRILQKALPRNRASGGFSGAKRQVEQGPAAVVVKGLVETPQQFGAGAGEIRLLDGADQNRPPGAELALAGSLGSLFSCLD